VARVLVTGGAGFIGSNIVERLLDMGEQVRVFDNFATGKRENVKEFEDRIEVVEGDIRSYEDVARAMEEVDYCIHQAALASVARSVKDPIASIEVNVAGTLNVLNAALECKVRRVVFASSSSVYGDTPTLPKEESMVPCPQSPYALTKLAGEFYCRMFYEKYGLATVALRYFNIFGPRQDSTSEYAAVIPKFITTLLDGRKPVIFGDGEQSRDFTFVANAVEANILALESEKAVGGVYNVGCGERITLKELLHILGDILGVEVEPEYAPPRPGDVRHSLASIERAKQDLGYKVLVGVREGLERTVAWFRKIRAEEDG